MPRNYWDGRVALICSSCPHYNAFPSVEELQAHILAEHPEYPFAKAKELEEAK